MDTNGTFEQPAAEPGLALNFEAQTYLREAGKWAYFLSILGFIGCGLLLLSAFSFGSVFARLAAVEPSQLAVALAGMGGFLTFFFILIDLLYFFFAFYLFQFGDRIKKGILFHDEAHVTAALGKLKSYFKLWGITTIVAIALNVLVVIVVIIAAIGAASMNR